jgi:AraC-like DNA-binding protein
MTIGVRSDRRPVGPGLPGVLRPGDGRPAVVPRRLQPAEHLRSIIDMYWSVAWDLAPGERHCQEVLAHPCGHLTVEGESSTITGVTTGRFQRVLEGSGRVVGVRFAPGGIAALVDVSIARLTDRSTPAAELLGADAHEALVAAGSDPDLDVAVDRVEAFVDGLLRPLPAGAAFVQRVVRHIVADRRVMRVDQLTEHFEVTMRTLQRHFERYLGVGPKWVIQRRRLHDALAEIDSGRRIDWSVLAHELGFVDQAHFVHTFSDVVGQPPTAYERTGPAR